MTFDGLENRMAEDIMHEIDNPTLIAAEVSKLLNDLKHQDMIGFTGSPKTEYRGLWQLRRRLMSFG